jgi:hypothetical protein
VSAIVQQLNRNLRNITIRDPIKTLFNPTFEFIESGDSTRLSLRIDTFDARSGERLYGIESFQMTPAYVLGRLARDEKFLGRFCYECLKNYIEHELQESMLIEGDFIVAPTHWGPKV